MIMAARWIYSLQIAANVLYSRCGKRVMWSFARAEAPSFDSPAVEFARVDLIV